MRRRLDHVARIWALAAFVAWFVLAAVALGAFTAATDAATAPDEPRLEHRRDTPQTTVDEVSSNVMCPSCDTTLDQSNSPAAQSMRDWVEEAVAAGWTEEEIRDGLVEEYGGDESILATPRASGIGLLAWIVPALVVLAAVGGGFVLMRGWRRGAQTRSGSSSYSHASSASSSNSPDASTSDAPDAPDAPAASSSR